MTILRSRCITRAFRPPREGGDQRSRSRNAQAKSTGGAASPARSGLPAKAGIEERESQATSKESVGAWAFHRLSSRPEKLRVRNFGVPGPRRLIAREFWVPGLASGLARDDNPPVALRNPRLAAGSAKSERASKEHRWRCITRAFRPPREGGDRGTRVASDKQRDGWRVGIPSFVIPAGEIARAQFWSAGTQETYRARVRVPGLASGLARDDNPPVALHHPRVPAGSAKSESERASKEHRWRCITRAFRPAPRSRNAQAKSTGGAASPARSGRLDEGESERANKRVPIPPSRTPVAARGRASVRQSP